MYHWNEGLQVRLKQQMIRHPTLSESSPPLPEGNIIVLGAPFPLFSFVFLYSFFFLKKLINLSLSLSLSRCIRVEHFPFPHTCPQYVQGYFFFISLVWFPPSCYHPIYFSSVDSAALIQLHYPESLHKVYPFFFFLFASIFFFFFYPLLSFFCLIDVGGECAFGLCSSLFHHQSHSNPPNAEENRNPQWWKGLSPFFLFSISFIAILLYIYKPPPTHIRHGRRCCNNSSR